MNETGVFSRKGDGPIFNVECLECSHKSVWPKLALDGRAYVCGYRGCTSKTPILDSLVEDKGTRLGDSAPDAIHPPHYTAHPSGVECITITEHFNFNLGNAIKYIWRAGLKGNQRQDLQKAAWYIAREIERSSKDAL